jgi:hypothetical protein
MITAALVGQRPAGIFQEEKPLQLGTRRLTREPAERRRLLIIKELNRHNP